MNKSETTIFIIIISTIMTVSVLAYNMSIEKSTENQSSSNANWQWNNDWGNEKPIENKGEEKLIKAKNYEEALSLSKKHGMPTLVIFGADWCGWCKKLKNETMETESVKLIMKNYIVSLVDVDKRRDITRKFGVEGVPAYIISNWEENVLKSGVGFKDEKEFSKWLNEPKFWKSEK